MARRLHIKIIEALNLLNIDSDDQLNPYVSLRLKNQDKRDINMTEVKNNTNNPVWNQNFNILAVDPNDVLLINIFNKGIKKDEKIIEELQFPVNMFQILAPVERKEIDLKFKKKKNFLSAGRLIFEIQAVESVESKPRNPNDEIAQLVQCDGCKIHIKAFDAKDVFKMDLGAKPDPYLRFRIKDTVVISEIAHNTTNPVWNEELDIVSRDPKHDILEIDLVDNDLNKNQIMMNQIVVPISEHQFGDHYVFDDFIKLKKKNAGKLHFELDFTKSEEKYVHPVNRRVKSIMKEQELNNEKSIEKEIENIEPEQQEEVNDEPEKIESVEKEELFEENHNTNPVEEKQTNVGKEKVDEQPVEIEKKPALKEEQCKVIVVVDKCENLMNDTEKLADSYVSLQIKGDSESIRKTKVIDNNNNPIWNESFEFNIKNRNTDILLVNLYNKEEKIMDELSFTLRKWVIGTHVDYSQDIKLGEKDAGRISLQFNVLRDGSNSDGDEAERTPFKIGESIKGAIVLANGLPKTNSNGSDTYCVLSLFSPHDKDKKDKIKTGVEHNTQDPVWNKGFDFPRVNDGDFLRVEVFQSHKFGGDQCIAFTDIPIRGITENEKVEQKFKLEKPTKVPKSIKKITDFGSITLSLIHNVQYH